MSFYGQVLYEFSKLFSQINIANNSNNNVVPNPIEISDQSTISPLERWDQLGISGGNRWINLQSNPINKTISIFHTTPGEADDSKKVIGITKVESLPDDITAEQLDYGDILQTTISEYDAAGHSIGASTTYFQLPKGEMVENVQELQDNMGHIFDYFLTTEENPEKRGKYIEEYLTEKDYLKQENLENNMSNYLSTHNYVTTALTGNKSDINTTSNTENWTLAATLGRINMPADSLKVALDTVLKLSEDQKQISSYSIADAIIELIKFKEIQDTEIATIKSANMGYSAYIDQLNAKITNLEEQIQNLDARLQKLESPPQEPTE